MSNVVDCISSVKERKQNFLDQFKQWITYKWFPVNSDNLSIIDWKNENLNL